MKNYLKKYVLAITNTCNLNCIYCSQYERMKESNKPVINENDINNMLEYIDKEFKENPEIFEDSVLPITFYGGEPTLSFNTIQSIVEYLKKYGNKIEFRMMTNGTLLNQEYVDFLNNNNFHITISWDGKNTVQTRGIDVFKENSEYILQLKDMNVESVMTKYNTPYDTLMALSPYSQKYYIMHNKYIQHRLYPVKYHDDLYPDDYTAWKDDVQKILTSNDEHIKSFIEYVTWRIQRQTSTDTFWVSDSKTTVTPFQRKTSDEHCQICKLKPICVSTTIYSEKFCKMFYETYYPIVQHSMNDSQTWFIN